MPRKPRLLFSNAKATIVRGTPPVMKFGPEVRADVQMSTLQSPAEALTTLESGLQLQGYTHQIFLEDNVDSDYQPLADDLVIISQSKRGKYDGYYVVQQYPSVQLASGTDDLDHISLYVRFLGKKKPGDIDPNDNSGIIRLGRRG